jgi:hypothetical protein
MFDLDYLIANRRPLWQALAEYDAQTDALAVDYPGEWCRRMDISDYLFRTLSGRGQDRCHGHWFTLRHKKKES